MSPVEAAGYSKHVPSMPLPQPDADDEGAPQLWRYLAALNRRRWLILSITVIGATGGFLLSRLVKPEYEAQATLWIEASSDQQQQGPIRTAELLQSAGWIELLRSFTVLDHVVNEQRLYVEAEPQDRDLFSSFSLQPRFRPEEYRLEVTPNGEEYVLSSSGAEVERGRVGSPIGNSMGFTWTPDRSELPAGRAVSFTVLNPRDVAIELAAKLNAQLSAEGTFLRLALSDTDPVHAATTINALSERYVSVAAELKRDRLVQLTGVLDEQRRYAEENLRQAEMQLESFRVETVTLPTDDSGPVAVGLEITRDPVMSRFFDMQIAEEQLRRDREAIERILSEVGSGSSLEELMVVPATQEAPALQQALTDRAQLRRELRVILQRYTEDHPFAKRISENLAYVEQTLIPQLAGELRTQLLAREAEIAERIGAATIDLRQIPPRAIEEARLERQVAIAENLHSMLKQRFEEARLGAASTIPDIRILDEAVAPTRATRDSRSMVIALGFLGSFGLAIMGVIAADRLDSRVRYPEEVTRGMGLPILGAVPSLDQTKGKKENETTSKASEAFREIRLNLLHAHGTAGPLMLTITSPGSGDGKSFISSNVGLALGEQGYRTLIIDGDVRRGSLHHTFGTSRTPGLTDYLSGNATLDEVLQETSFPNVFLLPSGTRMANGPELLGSNAMSQLLMELRPHFGAFVVDSPPLGAGVDAFALGALTRNLLLVLRTGTTDRALATAKLEMVDRLPIRVLGAILNGTPYNSHAYKYYAYISGYEATEEEAAVGQLQESSV